MITIKNVFVFSTEVFEKSGVCIHKFSQPILFVDCEFSDCAKIHIENNPHKFAVI